MTARVVAVGRLCDHYRRRDRYSEFSVIVLTAT